MATAALGQLIFENSLEIRGDRDFQINIHNDPIKYNNIKNRN